MLINWEIHLILTAIANQDATLTLIHTELQVLVIIVLIEDNIKLLEQLKSGFKRAITKSNINQK